MSSTIPSPSPAPAPTQSRVVATAAIGNLVEWYDFALYAYSATAISHAFFPHGNDTVAVLSTLAVFGVSFLLRPLGGLVLGRIGDKIGRRSVLSTAVLGMGVCTVLMGLIPTYEAIGVAAPILLVLTRLGQGFFSGGEYTGASTFLVEHAPSGRRGLWAGISVATGTVPFAFAGFIVLAFTAMPADAYASWGWRLPFVLAGPLALVGLYLRLKIAETPQFRALEEHGGKESAPLRTVLSRHRPAVLMVMGIAGLNSVAMYTLTSYMPTYLKKNVGTDPMTATVTNSIVVALVCVLVPLYGRLSDSIGRKKVLITGAIGLLVLAAPSFVVLSSGAPGTAFLGQLIFIVPFGCVAAVLSTVMCELFPTAVRYSGASTGYNIAYAIFGGTAPFVGQFLVDRTGVLSAPGLYVAALALLVVPIAFLLPETYRRTLGNAAHSASPSTTTGKEMVQP
ncbi:MFS transporter [Kribbella sp. NPDC004536]|uniref:MFS transporter n=1 Tax=Kribbella sp. NPDC004536 TaxID=3364106 RepID=UPI0036CFC877